jgi:O-Antigen ligase
MRAAAGLLFLSAACTLITISLFFGGSLGDGRLFWIGIFAEALGFGAVAAGLAGLLPVAVPTRVGLAAVGLLAAFVSWQGMTMIWSIAPDRSWAYLNRGAVYVAFCLLGLAVAAYARMPARIVAGGLSVLLFGVVGWALLGKVFPSLFPDGARVARLRNPIGYWNALALACALALPLGLWLATRRTWRRELRVAGVLFLYLAVIALVLTFSRAGILVAAVAVLLWLAFAPARLESLGALVLSVVPAAAVAGWASTRTGLVDDNQPLGARRSDGAWFAFVVIVVGAIVVGTALWADGADRRFEDGDARRLWARRIGVAIGTVVVAGVIAVSAASGGPGAWLKEFRGGGEVASGSASRIATLSSNNRWAWWQEAWRVFEEKPAGGKGAGTFELARRSVRGSGVVTIEPHNLALQALSETGIVGFLLGLGAVLCLLVALTRTVRRLRGEERAAAVALAIAVPAYLLHALADIDWDFVAVSAPVFFLGGLVLGMGGEVRAVRVRGRPLLAAGAAACLLAGVYSLAAPWLASNRVDDAYAALASNEPAAAASDARDAAGLNPLSPEPIWALASAYASVGDVKDAGRQYGRATRLQPENSDTWVALGRYELCFGDVFAAYRALNHAYTLDPYGPAGIKNGPLDQARAAVEKRGTPTCRR